MCAHREKSLNGCRKLMHFLLRNKCLVQKKQSICLLVFRHLMVVWRQIRLYEFINSALINEKYDVIRKSLSNWFMKKYCYCFLVLICGAIEISVAQIAKLPTKWTQPAMETQHPFPE